MMKVHTKILAPAFVLLMAIELAFPWGQTGHSYINQNSVQHLPSTMQMFIDKASFLATHASDADFRKSTDPTEGPKHFLDIDAYPEFFTGTLTHNLDSLIAKYGSTTVASRGLLPWATVWTMDSLEAQMRRGDWSGAFLTAADLGHYVGDAHQPLHATANYNPGGLHSRYETTMINQKVSLISTVTDTVAYISSPLEYAFSHITHSWSLVAPLIRADSLAKVASGGSTSSTAYYDALWDHSSDFTIDQFHRATVALANLLYTAWVRAGMPEVPVTQVQEKKLDLPTTLILEQNYPNPFNPTTSITYHLPAAGWVTLKVLNILGHEVQTLVDQYQGAGTHRVTFNASELPSGIYFYQIRTAGVVETKRMALIR